MSVLPTPCGTRRHRWLLAVTLVTPACAPGDVDADLQRPSDDSAPGNPPFPSIPVDRPDLGPFQPPIGEPPSSSPPTLRIGEPLARPDAREAAVVQTLPQPSAVCDGAVAPGISAADLDNDGDLDVLVPACSRVWWLENRDGTLTDRHTLDLSTGDNDPAVTAWAWDVDDDGLTDILYGGYGGTRLWRGTADGFTPDDTLVVPSEPDRLPLSATLTHLDDDRHPDLFIGNGTRRLRNMIDGTLPMVWTPAMEDALFRGGPAGFIPEPLPAGHGWLSFHGVPVDDRLIMLTDFSGDDGESTAWSWSGGVTVSAVDDVIGPMRHPMGGFCDHLIGEGVTCWFSGVSRLYTFSRLNGLWYEDPVLAAPVRGTAGFKWSVALDDVDLDGRLDLILTSGNPFLYTSDLANTPFAERGARIHRQQADGTWETETVAPDVDVNGMTLADLDGDGVREIILRAIAPNASSTVIVYHRRVDGPRTRLAFHPTCVDAELEWGSTTRRFQPTTNTGTFGNGSFDLTFPWSSDDLKLTLAGQTWTWTDLPADHTVEIDCRPEPPAEP